VCISAPSRRFSGTNGWEFDFSFCPPPSLSDVRLGSGSRSGDLQVAILFLTLWCRVSIFHFPISSLQFRISAFQFLVSAFYFLVFPYPRQTQIPKSRLTNPQRHHPSFRTEQADFFLPHSLLRMRRPAQREISLTLLSGPLVTRHFSSSTPPPPPAATNQCASKTSPPSKSSHPKCPSRTHLCRNFLPTRTSLNTAPRL
jgi:hypothetical protein